MAQIELKITHELRQARITKVVMERKLKHHNTKASCTNKNDTEEKC